MRQDGPGSAARLDRGSATSSTSGSWCGISRISTTTFWRDRALNRLLPRWGRILAMQQPSTRFAGMAPAIELSGLRKTFHGHLGIGSTLAVDGLDLSVV